MRSQRRESLCLGGRVVGGGRAVVAVEAAAKAAPAGSSGLMRVYRMANWVITLFRRLVLGGIARISSWVLSHWASLYRDHIYKRSNILVATAVAFVVLSIWWG